MTLIEFIERFDLTYFRLKGLIELPEAQAVHMMLAPRPSIWQTPFAPPMYTKLIAVDFLYVDHCIVLGQLDHDEVIVQVEFTPPNKLYLCSLDQKNPAWVNEDQWNCIDIQAGMVMVKDLASKQLIDAHAPCLQKPIKIPSPHIEDHASLLKAQRVSLLKRLQGLPSIFVTMF